MIKVILVLAMAALSGCGHFAKDNKSSDRFDFDELRERDELYCSLSAEDYDQECDSALFSSLHALQCSYVDPDDYEYEFTGKLCRQVGCTCYDNDPRPKGERGSDSGFSKDMATGMQVYFSQYPEKDFAVRVQEYGIANNWIVCDADTTADLIGKCQMSPKIVYRWAEIERKASEQSVKGPPPDQDDVQLTQNLGFLAHLDILSIVVECNLYGGISDSSVKTIKDQAEREPNNLLYQAMLAKFVTGDEAAVAKKLLSKFPSDRLPTQRDWCSPYLYKRDEILPGQTNPNPDWLPCEGDKNHPGTDYLFASWVLQHSCSTN